MNNRYIVVSVYVVPRCLSGRCGGCDEDGGPCICTCRRRREREREERGRTGGCTGHVFSTRGVFESLTLLVSPPAVLLLQPSLAMSYTQRRVPPPQPTYSAVPTTSPRRSGSSGSRIPYSPPPAPSRAGARTPSAYSGATHYPLRYQTPPPPPPPQDLSSYYAQDETAHGVQTGAIGGGYGPYSVSSYPINSILTVR